MNYNRTDEYGQMEEEATIKKFCDGLDITLREFFDDPAFDDLEQEVK